MRSGDNLGVRADAERIANGIEQQLQAIAARVAGRPKPLVLLVIGRDPESLRNIYANGGYGFLHDMIDIAGGRDLFADVKRRKRPAVHGADSRAPPGSDHRTAIRRRRRSGATTCRRGGRFSRCRR